MSVLIKGMEMPRNCCECAIRSYDANGQEEYCPITEIECLSIGRQDACPLTEVIDVSGEVATEKQKEYAKYLAKRMCVELPKENTKLAYSEFISKWKPVVKEEDDAMNEPTRWGWSYY